MNTSWQEHLALHTTTALEAVQAAVQSGDFVVLGHAVATPSSLSQALFEDRDRLTDVKVFHMLYFAEPWHLRPEMKGHVQPILNFLDKNSRPAYQDKRVDFLPCHFHELPSCFTNGIYPVDVALISVSEPNEEGYCSFGVSCDYTKPAAEAARIVIAEINKQMPFIGGDNLIHVTKLDYIVPVDRPLVELPPPPIGEVEQRIGELCADLIHDGDTLQIGIGAIPDAVLQCLKGRHDLGLHTEMFTDGVMHMIQSGNVTGTKKTLHHRKVVSSIIMGSKALYDFVNKNDMIEMYPVDHINDPYVVGQNDNMVSINSCLEIDLYGQVASEAIGLSQFSGTGGQVDYLRGVKRSRGGRSILAFTSTAKGGTRSRIVPVLPLGATVTSGRNDVDYIATEYGVVRLRGLTLRERALALTGIAHPDFRPGLLEAIRERFD
ncbi:acetyl-CoA hydrolase/transferase family protein [Porphyromonas sp.]